MPLTQDVDIPSSHVDMDIVVDSEAQHIDTGIVHGSQPSDAT